MKLHELPASFYEKFRPIIQGRTTLGLYDTTRKRTYWLNYTKERWSRYHAKPYAGGDPVPLPERFTVMLAAGWAVLSQIMDVECRR